MSDSNSNGAKPISLEDLIALNDEIASLVCVGVPLELGLRGSRSSLQGRLRSLTDRLADSMSGGMSLPDALESEGSRFPRIYRAVVQTGLRAGRLPQALESLTRFAQSVVELRRRISLALMYPMTVLLIAYGLFVVFMMEMVPRITDAYRSFQIEFPWWLRTVQTVSDAAHIWGPGVPALIFLLAIAWIAYKRFLTASSDSQGITTGIVGLVTFGWTPWMKNFHRANFAELMALLIDHEVTLHDAVLLAAESTGNSQMIDGARRIADDVQAGRSLASSLQTTTTFPPFMQWMMSVGEQQGSLAPTLRQITEIYRRRALHQTEWVKMLLPVLLILFIGGGATFLYALTLFFPLTEILKGLNTVS